MAARWAQRRPDGARAAGKIPLPGDMRPMSGQPRACPPSPSRTNPPQQPQRVGKRSASRAALTGKGYGENPLARRFVVCLLPTRRRCCPLRKRFAAAKGGYTPAAGGGGGLCAGLRRARGKAERLANPLPSLWARAAGKIPLPGATRAALPGEPLAAGGTGGTSPTPHLCAHGGAGVRQGAMFGRPSEGCR